MQASALGLFPLFDASSYRVGIVVSSFNHDLTSGLLDQALSELERYQVKKTNITTITVAGCIEIPVVIEAMAHKKSFDCLIVLGVVIRGDTPHFEYVCKIVSEGVRHTMQAHTLPVGFGILTLNKKSQAAERLIAGASAAAAALQAAKAIKQIIE